MAEQIKMVVEAPNSIGIAIRVSKGNKITVKRKQGNTKAVDLGAHEKMTPRGLLTQMREWSWDVGDYTIAIYAEDDVDIHAVHVLQPPDPRQAPRPRRKGVRASRPEATT